MFVSPGRAERTAVRERERMHGVPFSNTEQGAAAIPPLIIEVTVPPLAPKYFQKTREHHAEVLELLQMEPTIFPGSLTTITSGARS